MMYSVMHLDIFLFDYTVYTKYIDGLMVPANARLLKLPHNKRSESYKSKGFTCSTKTCQELL